LAPRAEYRDSLHALVRIALRRGLGTESLSISDPIEAATSRSGELLHSAKRARPQPAVQVTRGGGFRGFESADGKYLYYAKGRGKQGLWRTSLPSTPNSKEEPILESLQAWGWWALSSRMIYFLEFSPSVTPRVQLKSLSLSDGRISEIVRLRNPVVSETPAIAASQDGKRVLYLQVGSTDADIMLLDHFR